MPRALTLLLTLSLLCACNLPAPAPALAIPTASPAATAAPTDAPAAPASTGYITFAINVHDWMHADQSADTLLRLVDLFEKYHVRGDFYFTPEVVRQYASEHPEVIERFKNSNMTISYHIRPPHPLYAGFDERLKGLSDAELEQTLRDYETYALDLSTGELDRSRPGGYSYVAQVFGTHPVVASAPSDNARLREIGQKVYASLGAQMTLMYHESGAKIEQPFETINGLLVRPSDFSVTRVTAINNSENFWWNYMISPEAARYNPTALLKSQLAEWESHQYGRAPFITVLIHENNYYRSGAESWSAIYFKMEKGRKTDPLAPPYNLNAPDPSKLRSEADREAIFAAYEELVACAAANLSVVTSADLLQLAGQAQ